MTSWPVSMCKMQIPCTKAEQNRVSDDILTHLAKSSKVSMKVMMSFCCRKFITLMFSGMIKDVSTFSTTKITNRDGNR